VDRGVTADIIITTSTLEAIIGMSPVKKCRKGCSVNLVRMKKANKFNAIM